MSAADITWTTTDAGTVKLGRTTYKVEITNYMDGAELVDRMVYLTGPRGATYFLRGFLGEDTGVRQVISSKSGQPLRDSRTQQEIRVVELGDVIEVQAR
jgi:hypothetical protein